MNRRSILGATTAVLATSIAGCAGTEDENEERDIDDFTDIDDDRYVDPPGYIYVYSSPNTPDDATVLDAEADSLLEDDYVKDALEEAKDEYDKEDHATSETELTMYPVDRDDVNSVRNTFDPDNRVEGKWYVTYSEVEFAVGVNMAG